MDGKLSLALADTAGKSMTTTATDAVTGNKWTHVLAEVDRAADTVTIYMDGDAVARVSGKPGSLGSLANSADFHVAGAPTGDHLAADFEFLRVARGSLADAQTSIEEVLAWQLDGPFRYDFAGTKRTEGHAAGALAFP